MCWRRCWFLFWHFYFWFVLKSVVWRNKAFIELFLSVYLFYFIDWFNNLLIVLNFPFLNASSLGWVAKILIPVNTHHLWFITLSGVWELVIIFNYEVNKFLLALWKAIYWKLKPFLLNTCSFLRCTLANLKLKYNRVNFKKMVLQLFHDLMELNLVMTSKDGKQVWSVCIDVLST